MAALVLVVVAVNLACELLVGASAQRSAIESGDGDSRLMPVSCRHSEAGIMNKE